MNKKALSIILVIITLAGCQGNDLDKDNKMIVDSNNAIYKESIQSFHSVNLNESVFENVNTKKPFKVGVTSHHLPVAAPFIGDFYEELLKYKREEKIAFVIGPDHPEKCQEAITTGSVVYRTGFGDIDTDEEIIQSLVDKGLVNEEPKCLEYEHSIGVQTDYLDLFLPEIKIVPIVLSSSTSDLEVKTLAEELNKYYEDSLYIVSVDFNHYRTVEQSLRYDEQTRKAINTLDPAGIEIDHVDSPPSLKLGFELAKLNDKKARIFGETNSYAFTGQYSNTTSYFNVAFE